MNTLERKDRGKKRASQKWDREQRKQISESMRTYFWSHLSKEGASQNLFCLTPPFSKYRKSHSLKLSRIKLFIQRSVHTTIRQMRRGRIISLQMIQTGQRVIRWKFQRKKTRATNRTNTKHSFLKKYDQNYILKECIMSLEQSTKNSHCWDIF